MALTDEIKPIDEIIFLIGQVVFELFINYVQTNIKQTFLLIILVKLDKMYK